MSRAVFPTLLNQKASLIGALTREDLVLLGAFYLLLSWMKVEGLFSLGLIFSLYFVLKVARGKLPRGFFKHLKDSRVKNWSYKLGDLYE